MPLTLEQKLLAHLEYIYPDKDQDDICARIMEVFWPEGAEDKPLDHPAALSYDTWSQSTSVVITYGNSIVREGEAPLKTLKDFLDTHLKDVVQGVHILPFFPYSSDDGFAVMDYRQVREGLGGWEDISDIGEDFYLMSDLVLNHASAQGNWFKEFQEGNAPYKDYFFTAPGDSDVSLVVRPRPSPLLVPFETAEGEKHVWCTFGPDQVDLDFSNPEVLIEFISIMRLYLEKNVRIFRLDAVAFLWKELGTNCLHQPQTHEIIRLMRTLFDHYYKDVLVITETNVPHHENLSYFGNQNEAHLIYNFTLPPLLIQALLTGNEYYLKRWLMSNPPTQTGCTYLNFVAGHDGIGLRPASGILMDQDLEEMIECIKGFGGKISMRAAKDENEEEKPYEMNISLFDALKGTIDGEDEYQRERFMASQLVMMSLEGIPAFYIHSLLATPNDYEKMERTKHNRSINRHHWNAEELEALLADPASNQSYAMNEIKRALSIRVMQPAFHPNALQFTLQLPPGIFGFWRQSIDRKQDIFCVFNITNEDKVLPLHNLNLYAGGYWSDLLSDQRFDNRDDEIILNPYQGMWISNWTYACLDEWMVRILDIKNKEKAAQQKRKSKKPEN